MARKVNVTIVPGTTAVAIRRARQITRRELTGLISRVIVRLEGNVVERTPVGASHALRGGYRSVVVGKMTAKPIGKLINPVLYHDAVEEGRAPGKMPPVEALMPWVAAKLGIGTGPMRRRVAFLVARSIGAHGTEGQEMVERGWKETRRMIGTELTKLGVRIVRELDRE